MASDDGREAKAEQIVWVVANALPWVGIWLLPSYYVLALLMWVLWCCVNGR